MNHQTHGDISVFDTDPELAARLVRYLASPAGEENFEPGTVALQEEKSTVDESLRRCDDFNLSAVAAWDEEAQALNERLYRVFVDALGAHMILGCFEIPVLKDTGFLAVRYRPGGEYVLHVDDGTAGARSLSLVYYANDDYTGGELVYPRQRVEIRPKAGRLVIFPSNFLFPHAGMPVLEGTKYALVTWYREVEGDLLWRGTPDRGTFRVI